MAFEIFVVPSHRLSANGHSGHDLEGPLLCRFLLCSGLYELKELSRTPPEEL